MSAVNNDMYLKKIASELHTIDKDLKLLIKAIKCDVKVGEDINAERLRGLDEAQDSV